MASWQFIIVLGSLVVVTIAGLDSWMDRGGE